MATNGRPLKFKTVDELKAACDSFFAKCEEDKAPFTITGLALHIGTCRQTIQNYQGRKKFLDTIKEAKLKCENYAEIQLFTSNPTGPIFALKNYGWTDKQKEEASDTPAPVEINIIHESARKD